jgi:phospho-2-dehydro-3-deoxyheptonate aldolase
MPTGFKNSTDGSIGIAVDACRAAKTPHVFLSVGKEGLSSIVETEVRQPIMLCYGRPDFLSGQSRRACHPSWRKQGSQLQS